MADEGFQERTEQATPRKLSKAKEKGQIARSKDLASMFSMGGIVLILYFGGQYFFRSLYEMTGGIFSMRYGIDPVMATRTATLQGAQILAPFFLASVALGILGSVMQGGFIIKEFKIELDKLDPVNGAKQLFSSKGLGELMKSFLKFAIGGWVVYYIIDKDMELLPSLAAMEMGELIKVSSHLIMEAIVIAFFYFLVVAIISYFIEKWQFDKSLKMSKQEIREEHKETEGDPIIKARIRSIQRETAKNRMMKEVPKATVVITNPTHLAVALKYEDKKMFAPRVVAKGAGVIAAKIREIATENGVPIVEDKPLARSLYKLELNSFIPEELYVAVAKILAYIYKLKGKI